MSSKYALIAISTLLELCMAKSDRNQRNDEAGYEAAKKIKDYMPKFTEMFDEETFYIFCALLVLCWSSCFHNVSFYQAQGCIEFQSSKDIKYFDV